MELTYTELMDAMANTGTGVNGQMTTHGKLVFINEDDEFLGRQCSRCHGIMQSPQLVKQRSVKFGHSSICKECNRSRIQKKRSCSDYRRQENVQNAEYRKTVDGTVKEIIANLRTAAMRNYGVDIPRITDSQRERLKERLESAMDSGKCPYSGKRLSRENVSAEHPIAISRQDTDVFQRFGYYDAIIFVDVTENKRKNDRPLIEYLSRWATPEQAEKTIAHLSEVYGITTAEVEELMAADLRNYENMKTKVVV